MGGEVKKPSLTTWIFAGLVAGIVFGVLFPAPASRLALLGSIFLRLIKSIVAPLVFATLVAGIASTGSVKTKRSSISKSSPPLHCSWDWLP